MRVRITRGIYGFMESGHLVEKTNRSAPFEVDEDEGKRLIMLNVAKQVSADSCFEEAFVPDENEETEGKESRDAGENGPGDALEDMALEELRAMAKEMGVKRSGSREELIERLRQCLESEGEEALDESDMPELTVEEPE